MEFRDALKSFRSEAGLAQTDIAAALHVNITTVARWEAGKTAPNRSFGIALLDYARSTTATDGCIENLENALKSAAKQKLFNNGNSLFAVEHATISQLIEDASFPIYVCDLDTDEILYLNHAAERQIGQSLDEAAGMKCYECIMRRNTPCEFCHKNQLNENSFGGFEACRHFDGSYYRVLGKLAKWNGHSAQIRYMLEVGGSVQIASRNEIRLKYEEQLEMRRQFASDALAVAHYNLTRGTVLNIEYRNDEIKKCSPAGGYEDAMLIMEDNIYSPEEREKYESIRDRSSLIRMFFRGETHISFKHRISGLSGYYKDSLDLFQNPITYDIEVFATLRDVTDEAVSDAVVGMIVGGNVESIVTIDAATGEAHLYHGKNMHEVITEQKKQDDNGAGVEAYLRLHCSDRDIERVIRQSGLPYVKEQLKIKPVLTVAYSIRDNGCILQKQARYSYLDEEQNTIICVTQDISEAYRQLKA